MDEDETDRTVNTNPTIKTYYLRDDGTFPNNNSLPLLIYENVFNESNLQETNKFSSIFRDNGWHGIWHNGIYSYHHYHSTAHEVLGISRGEVKVKFGGPDGVAINLTAGEIALLPAGVTHQKSDSSDHYRVVGAYPPGQTVDMNSGKSGERPDVDANIRQVSLPEKDPVYGANGPLNTHWK